MHTRQYMIFAVLAILLIAISGRQSRNNIVWNSYPRLFSDMKASSRNRDDNDNVGDMICIEHATYSHCGAQDA